MRGGHRCAETNLSFLRCSKSDCHKIIRKRRQYFPAVLYAIMDISHSCHSLSYIKITIILCKLLMTWKLQIQVTNRLIGHTMICPAEKLIVDHILCCLIFPSKYELTYPVKRPSLHISLCIGIRLTRPDCFFVELEPFALWPSEYHSTQASVSDRKSLHPLDCRLVIPQFHIIYRHIISAGGRKGSSKG